MKIVASFPVSFEQTGPNEITFYANSLQGLPLPPVNMHPDEANLFAQKWMFSDQQVQQVIDAAVQAALVETIKLKMNVMVSFTERGDK